MEMGEISTWIQWGLGVIFALIATLVGGAVAWIHQLFQRNDRDHGQIHKGVDRVGRKIDHILIHHNPKMPPFEDKEEQ